jgi:3-isopropylmalate/(R)-2-methylmalate dehydratase small subunit
LPIKLSDEEIDTLFVKAAKENIELTVDLINNQINCGDLSFTFSLDKFHQYCLEQGIDSVGWTLNKLDKIKAFEAKLPSWQ